MAVSDILISLHGNFVPTGVYSFEYRTGDGKRITEIYFMLPPNSISWDEPQRAALEPTMTGGVLFDYGNEFKTGSVSGECHFYYLGNTRNPSFTFGLTKQQGIPDVLNMLDGYTEYRKLLFMCMRYRDYTMTEDGKIIAPDFTGMALAPVNALKSHVKQLLSSGKGALTDQIVTVWHDYDKDDHLICKINSFRSEQSNDDPWTIKYSLDLSAYGIDRRRPRTKLKGAGISGVSVNKKVNYRQIISRWNKVVAQTHIESRPEEVTINAVSKTSIVVPSYTTKEEAVVSPAVTIPGFTL